MHQRDVRRRLGEFHHPVQGRIAAAQDGETLAGELRWLTHAVVERHVGVVIDVRHAERSRLEGADAARDHDGFRVELRAGCRLDQE